jgi:hypothetical protein
MTVIVGGWWAGRMLRALWPWSEIARLRGVIEWQRHEMADLSERRDDWRTRCMDAECRLREASRNDRRGPDGRYVGGGSGVV